MGAKTTLVNRRAAVKGISTALLTLKADLAFTTLVAHSQEIGRPVQSVDLDGDHPGVPAITPDWRYVVSVNQESSNLSLVRLSDMRLERTIPLSAKREPWKIAFSAKAPIGFVAHSSYETSHEDDSVVTVVNIESGRELAQIPVGKRPNGVAVDRESNLVIVTNKGSETVSVISAATFQVVKTIAVGRKPNDVAITPDNRFALVLNFEDASLSFIDLNSLSVAGTVQIGQRGLAKPYPVWGPGDSAQIAVHPLTGEAYITNYRSGNVAVVDTRQQVVRKHIPTIRFPFGVEVEANTNLLTVVSGESRQMAVIDLGLSRGMESRFELAPQLRSHPVVTGILAQTERQIEVVPWGQGAGKPPLRLTTSRAQDVTHLHVDPIKGLLYVLPAAPRSVTQDLLFGVPNGLAALGAATPLASATPPPPGVLVAPTIGSGTASTVPPPSPPPAVAPPPTSVPPPTIPSLPGFTLPRPSIPSPLTPSPVMPQWGILAQAKAGA